MPELGRAALVLCLGLALFALIGGAYAAATRRRRLARAAQNAPLAPFGTAAGAAGRPRGGLPAPGGAAHSPPFHTPSWFPPPPCLSRGSVGLTTPFASARGALLAGGTDELGIVAPRRWTLFAWTALGIGQLLGA